VVRGTVAAATPPLLMLLLRKLNTHNTSPSRSPTRSHYRRSSARALGVPSLRSLLGSVKLAPSARYVDRQFVSARK